MQAVFSRMGKQVIVELGLIEDEYHLLVGLEEEKVMTPKSEVKKTLDKRTSKKIIEKVT